MCATPTGRAAPTTPPPTTSSAAILAPLLHPAAWLGDEIVEIFLGLAAVVVLAAPLVLAALLFRRRMLRRDDARGDPGFTLSDLRALHEAGRLSDAELERAKRRAVESATDQRSPPSAPDERSARSESSENEASPDGDQPDH